MSDPVYPSVTLVCRTCRKTARRRLQFQAGCRGTRETEAEPAFCPSGHGQMEREDGFRERPAIRRAR